MATLLLTRQQGVGTKGRKCVSAVDYLSSNRSSSTTATIPAKNRFTSAFQEAKKACPQYIESYAKCVMQNHHAGTLEKSCCEEEFRLLKDCFKRCRRQTSTANI